MDESEIDNDNENKEDKRRPRKREIYKKIPTKKMFVVQKQLPHFTELNGLVRMIKF